MTTYYKATTNVSVSVVLPNKKSLRISFTPLSDGTSTYQTNREDVQTALERHYKFGKLFRLVRTDGAPDVVEEANKTPSKPRTQPAPVKQEAKIAAKEVVSEVQPIEEQMQETQLLAEQVVEDVVEQRPEQEEVVSEVQLIEEQMQETQLLAEQVVEDVVEQRPEQEEVVSEVQLIEEQIQEEEPEPETKLRKVKVSDLATAKDYLADKFGISRTTLRSHKSILAQAEAHGIVFVGI